jgi:hypothetical protein
MKGYRWLRAGASVLALLWFAAFFDLGHLTSSYLVYFIALPWLAGFVAVALLACRPSESGPEWVTLALLGGTVGDLLPGGLLTSGQEWWPSGGDLSDAAAEWLRLTRHFGPVWGLALAAAGVLFAYRTTRPDFRAADRGDRLATWGTAALGALGLIMAPAAVNALYFQHARSGGGGIVLYAATVFSLCLLGAAVRGPAVARGGFARKALVVGGVLLAIVVASCSLHWLPASSEEERGFWKAATWSVFAADQLGLDFAGLAAAWLLLAAIPRGRARTAPSA